MSQNDFKTQEEKMGKIPSRSNSIRGKKSSYPLTEKPKLSSSSSQNDLRMQTEASNTG